MSERFESLGERVVLDHKTGLMWQRGASSERMVWKDCFSYAQRLNREQFAGFGDWRVPSREELATLIEMDEERHSGLYIDPVFENQRDLWSATEGEHHKACYADFYYGDIYLVEGNYANYFVRAVRNQQEAQA